MPCFLEICRDLVLVLVLVLLCLPETFEVPRPPLPQNAEKGAKDIEEPSSQTRADPLPHQSSVRYRTAQLSRQPKDH